MQQLSTTEGEEKYGERLALWHRKERKLTVQGNIEKKLPANQPPEETQGNTRAIESGCALRVNIAKKIPDSPQLLTIWTQHFTVRAEQEKRPAHL